MTMGVHVLPKHYICLEKNVYVLLAQQNTNMKKEKENSTHRAIEKFYRLCTSFFLKTSQLTSDYQKLSLKGGEGALHKITYLEEPFKNITFIQKERK